MYRPFLTNLKSPDVRSQPITHNRDQFGVDLILVFLIVLPARLSR